MSFGLTYSNARAASPHLLRSNIPIFRLHCERNARRPRILAAPTTGPLPGRRTRICCTDTVTTPWIKRKFSSQIRIFQDGKRSTSCFLSTKSVLSSPAGRPGLRHHDRRKRIAGHSLSDSLVRPHPPRQRDIELAIFCHDARSYRPETFKATASPTTTAPRSTAGRPAQTLPRRSTPTTGGRSPISSRWDAI